MTVLTSHLALPGRPSVSPKRDSTSENVREQPESESRTDRNKGSDFPPPRPAPSQASRVPTRFELSRWALENRQRLNGIHNPEVRNAAHRFIDEVLTQTPPRPCSTAALSEALAAEVEALNRAHAAITIGGVVAPAPFPKVTRTSDETINKFNDASSRGGLLLTAVDSTTIDEFFDGRPEDNKKLSFSYVRGDTMMQCFASRNMGFLVDATRAADRVLTDDDGRLLIDTHDVVSGTPHIVTARDREIEREDVGKALDQMLSKQNHLKKAGKHLVGNWNEVQALHPEPEACLGMFYAWPTTQPYDTVFSPARKSDLARRWYAKTGQRALNIYVYKHGGNPRREEAERAKALLGRPGASQLHLVERVELTPGRGREHRP